MVKEALQLLIGDPPRPAPWIDSTDTLSVKVGESIVFRARGGIGPPYVYGCYEGSSGMSRIDRIDDLSARYTPLRVGVDRVYINDTKYNAFTTAPIRITAP
jgi:hypothetical protein